MATILEPTMAKKTEVTSSKKPAWFWLTVAVIIFLTAFTRLFELGKIPTGLGWDEAAIGYNGYAILTKRRDEWLVRLPLSFRSFGDYKAPLAIYVNGPFTMMFGSNAWAVRLPFALMGILAAPFLMWMVLQLWPEEEEKTAFPVLSSSMAALVAGIFLLTSPWHMQFSRIAFESGLALTFLIAGTAFYLAMIQQMAFQNTKKQVFALCFAVFSILCFAASMYAYHSAKVVVPAVWVLLAWFCWSSWKRVFPQLMLLTAVLSLLLLPLGKDFLYGNGGTRLTQASILSRDGSIVEKGTILLQNTLAQFQPSYLVGGETSTLRHGDGQWGILFPSTFLLVLASLLLWPVTRPGRKLTRLTLFAAGWTIVGTLPAVIGQDVPHSNRAFLALPGFVLLTLLGWQQLVLWLHQLPLNQKLSGSKLESDLLPKAVIGTMFLLHSFFVCSYLHHYFGTYAAESADAFQSGYVEAMEYVKLHENEVDKVIMTSSYQHPYIYVLFAKKVNPIAYQGGILGKYEFNDQINASFLLRPKTLIVATPLEIDPEKADTIIRDPAGKPRFVIVKTGEK